jgi:outer membrane protein
MTLWRTLVPLMLTVIFAALPASAEPPRHLNLSECVDLALKNNRALRRSNARVDGADAARLSMRGRFGPVGRVEANIIYWDKESMISMAPPGIPVDPVLVRERTTSQIIGSVIQPLTGLAVVSGLYSATAHGADAARHDHAAAQNDVVLAVATAYFNALKAEQFARISELSIKQIQAHLSEAASFHRSGLIGKDAVLDAEVRLSGARAQRIQAKGALDLARANLAFQMGVPVTEVIIPVDVAEGQLAARPGGEAADLNFAVSHRAELAASSERMNQAEAAADAAWFKMLPEVSGIFSMQHTEGNALVPEDEYFVGLQASWNVWEWGATYYQVEEAEARQREASAARDEIRDAVLLEVRQARIALRTATEQHAVAVQAVKHAVENVRIVQRRFEEHDATGTEVLDAQARQVHAEVLETHSYYDAFRAAVALRRALGSAPSETTFGGSRGRN